MCFFSSLKRKDKSIGAIWSRIILKLASKDNTDIFKELLVFGKSWWLVLILKCIYNLFDTFSKKINVAGLSGWMVKDINHRKT